MNEQTPKNRKSSFRLSMRSPRKTKQTEPPPSVRLKTVKQRTSLLASKERNQKEHRAPQPYTRDFTHTAEHNKREQKRLNNTSPPKLSTNLDGVYAFIDSQNLHLGIQSQGWQLDWRVFRQYLKSKYRVTQAYVFIGQVEGNEPLYTYLKTSGFELVFKPTLYHLEEDQRVVKGNVDAELVLHTMIHYPHFSKAIIVTGDGDFHCLVEYLEKNGKLRKILTPTQHYSSLLRRFSKYIVRIDQLEKSLKRKETGIRGRSKP